MNSDNGRLMGGLCYEILAGGRVREFVQTVLVSCKFNGTDSFGVSFLVDAMAGGYIVSRGLDAEDAHAMYKNIRSVCREEFLKVYGEEKDAG